MTTRPFVHHLSVLCRNCGLTTLSPGLVPVRCYECGSDLDATKVIINPECRCWQCENNERTDQ